METPSMPRGMGAPASSQKVGSRSVTSTIMLAVGACFERRVGGDFRGPAHDQRDADAAFLDLALVAAKAAVGVEFDIVLAAGTAVVGLEDDERVVGDGVGRVAVVVGVFEGGEDIAEVRVDAGDHGGPLPRLIGKRGEVRVVGVGFVPVGECGDFAKGGVGDLDGEEAEEGLARLVVVLALGADEVERGEGVGVVAVGGFGIVGVVLAGQECWDSPRCSDSGPSSWG